jgi:type IV pilus assembly protein PilY1
MSAMIAVCGLAAASSAHAQTGDPDIRNIQPFVMVIVDSSGSMERLPNCLCTTLGCTECLPDCTLLNDTTTHEPPAGKKNRWSVLLESLTGKFTDYQCNELARTAENGMTYDIGYSIPYHQPWACPTGTVCPYPGTSTSPIQLDNGLLDNYAGRLRFGLMTFDGFATYTGAPDLVPAATFNTTLSNTSPGSWSYGGAKTFHYPTCTTDYMMDTGVRSPNAPEGALISLNSCATPPCDMYAVNAAIQSSLLATRSFGGIPIAGSLDDLYYHFKNDMTDTYASCRGRYAVLITDGYPDDDYRKYPYPGCNCKAEGNCPSGEDPNAMHCPYPTAEDAAYNLIHGQAGDVPQMQKLFVVGISIGADTLTKQWLNLIASNGGSTDTDGDGNEAFFADDPSTLTSTLDSLFGGLSKPVSRSVPAFATGLSSTQYQISAGFQVSNDRPVAGIAPPWTGILERRRFLCDGSTLSSPTLDSSQGDRFQEVLNAQSSRNLFTAMPSSGVTSAILNGALDRATSSSKCGTTYCTQTDLSAVNYQWFGLPDNTGKQTIIDWMYGAPGSVRAGKKLGDIYHSSPTVIGPPNVDPGDDSYTLFRDSPVVMERPVVLYIGTNDGILHAFSVEAFPPTSLPLTVHSGTTFAAGQEIWGFVPPLVLDNLKDQLTSHQMSMDGTPVVKDVYFSKSGTATAADYHTVLITGMRAGGNAYIAMDVTDPIAPKFLWQFTDPDMGLTYGQPEIVQATYEWPAGSTATLRAMAILPGGVGKKDTTGTSPGCSGMTTQSMKVIGSSGTRYTTLSDVGSLQALQHRSEVQCWQQKGRALYFVDVETGQLIKKIFDDDNDVTNGIVFPSPISGSPTAYQDTVGTVATEGFVIDQDGLMWRIDLTATNPRPTEPYAGWTVRPFHDLFWDMKPTDGETSYERPILSLDSERRLVVIAGTGDNDNFDKPTVQNRVVSLTEVPLTGTPLGADDYTAALNWELRVDGDNGFVPSELVTGTMALFEGQLYIGSFISVANTSNACDYGRGRLWSVDYQQRNLLDPNPSNGTSTTNPTASSITTYGPKRLSVVDTTNNLADSGASLFNVDVATAEPNLLIQGLGATQRLTCQPADTGGLSSFYLNNSLPAITQSAQPAIWIVAQASSNNSGRQRAGSLLGSLELRVNRQATFSKVSSWAGSID